MGLALTRNPEKVFVQEEMYLASISRNRNPYDGGFEMADLAYDDEETKESWLMWALEFGRRGLWPDMDNPEIEIHGPHPRPSNCYWGSAFCECPNFWLGKEESGYLEIQFQSREIKKYRRHTDPLTGLGIRVWTDVGAYGGKQTFPILAVKD